MGNLMSAFRTMDAKRGIGVSAKVEETVCFDTLRIKYTSLQAATCSSILMRKFKMNAYKANDHFL